MSADIIPFPTPSHGVKGDDEPLYTEADLDALAEWTHPTEWDVTLDGEPTLADEWEASDGDDHVALAEVVSTMDFDDDDPGITAEWSVDDDGTFHFDEPDQFIEADGKWVWLPEAEDPTGDVPVGMVGHSIKTLCRWQWRHRADGLTAPQQCCYSVLVTTARLPGPVRTERTWLAEAE